MCRGNQNQSGPPGPRVGSLSVSNADFAPLDNISVKLTAPNGRSTVIGALPDTGANVSCIAPSELELLGFKMSELQSERRFPSSADGSKLNVLGQLALEVTLGQFSTTVSLLCCEELVTTNPVIEVSEVIALGF